MCRVVSVQGLPSSLQDHIRSYNKSTDLFLDGSGYGLEPASDEVEPEVVLEAEIGTGFKITGTSIFRKDS